MIFGRKSTETSRVIGVLDQRWGYERVKQKTANSVEKVGFWEPLFPAAYKSPDFGVATYKLGQLRLLT